MTAQPERIPYIKGPGPFLSYNTPSRSLEIMADVKQPLPSPGFAGKRKGPKERPKLPLSVFTPPASGASDRFLLPPSPSAIHPTKVTDAHVSDFNAWKAESESAFGSRADGIVLSARGVEEVKEYVVRASVLSFTEVRCRVKDFQLERLFLLFPFLCHPMAR